MKTLKIRADFFIPFGELPPLKRDDTGMSYIYDGDGREFTPHAVNSGRSRVEQEVFVDFEKKEVLKYKRTGVTVEKVVDANGRTKVRTGQALDDGITCDNIEWKENGITFEMKASVSNPLVPTAPTVDYHLSVSVLNGKMKVSGSHDGFPCFEFYRQVNFGEFEEIHTHDFRRTNNTLEDMGGDMDYTFSKIFD